jgi:hypothetical protein
MTLALRKKYWMSWKWDNKVWRLKLMLLRNPKWINCFLNLPFILKNNIKILLKMRRMHSLI